MVCTEAGGGSSSSRPGLYLSALLVFSCTWYIGIRVIVGEGQLSSGGWAGGWAGLGGGWVGAG